MKTSREAKAHAIVAAGYVTKCDSEYLVQSESSATVYRVWWDEHGPVCTCADFANRRVNCKHIISAAIVAQREQEAMAGAL